MSHTVMSTCIYCGYSASHKVLRRKLDDRMMGWQLECIDCFSRTPLNYNELLMAKLLKSKDVEFDPRDAQWDPGS